MDESKEAKGVPEGIEDVIVKHSEYAPPSLYPEKHLARAFLSFTTVAMMFLIACVSSTVSIYVYDRWFAQKVVTADIEEYLKDVRMRYAAGEMSNDQAVSSLKHYINFVKAQPKNRVVILKDVVPNSVEELKLR